jgi:hypothetical protein
LIDEQILNYNMICTQTGTCSLGGHDLSTL